MPSGDYEYGGTFLIKMISNSFSFMNSCNNREYICPEQELDE